MALGPSLACHGLVEPLCSGDLVLLSEGLMGHAMVSWSYCIV